MAHGVRELGVKARGREGVIRVYSVGRKGVIRVFGVWR